MKILGKQRIAGMNAHLSGTFVAPNKNDAMDQAKRHEDTIRKTWAEDQDTHDTIILYHKQFKLGKKIQGVEVARGEEINIDLQETLKPVHFHLAFVIVIQWQYEDDSS